MKSLIRILYIFVIFTFTVHAAEGVQSLPLLQSKIEQYVLNELSSYADGKIHVEAGKIDNRLNLKACDESLLAIFNPYQTTMLSSNTVGIKCKEETNHWTLYVPIKISVLKTIYIAKRPLLKGMRLTEQDIYQTELDVQKLKQGYFIDSHDLIGQLSKQNIPANTPLTPFNIELAKMVHKGEQVTIQAINDNLIISMEGIAMNDGTLGESIKVKNLSSKKVIDTQVTGAKKVKVVL